MACMQTLCQTSCCVSCQKQQLHAHRMPVKALPDLFAASANEADKLVAGLLEAELLFQLLHGCIPGQEVLVAQVIAVCQGPLPPAVVVRPGIAFPAETGEWRSEGTALLVRRNASNTCLELVLAGATMHV